MITFNEAQLTAWLSPLVWPFIRVLALFSALPIFNRRNVPMRIRIALAAFITVTAQASLPEMPVVPLDSALAVMLVVQQVLIGVTIGFAVRLVFAAVEYA
ncbi:MAG: flagellar biosynthetic protein FliR, partial [Rubrivivax sp.]